MQEAFLRVHRSRERYRPDARFSTWLYRIATNLALNELRRPRRSRQHASTDAADDPDRPPLQLVSNEQPADEQLEVRRRAGRIEGALAQLTERQRMALWLRAVEGMSYIEIAQSLNTTQKSVKSLIHRARAALLESDLASEPKKQETKKDTRP